MILALFHPGDLSMWELLLVLALGGILLLLIVVLPICLIVFVISKLIRHHKEISVTRE